MVGGENWQVAGGFERNISSFSITKGESMNPGPNAWNSQGKQLGRSAFESQKQKENKQINK